MLGLSRDAVQRRGLSFNLGRRQDRTAKPRETEETRNRRMNHQSRDGLKVPSVVQSMNRGHSLETVCV